MGDYSEIGKIKAGQRDKVQAERDKANAEYKQARADLQTLRESADAEGVEFKPGSDSFNAITEQSRLVSERKQAADELDYAYKALLDVDGILAGTVDDGVKLQQERADAHLETQKRERKTMVSQAVDTIMSSPAYKQARDIFAKGVSAGDAVPNITLNDVVSREAVMGFLFQAAGDNVVTGLSDTLAGAFVWPEQDPRFIDLPFRRFTVLDAVNKTTTDSDAIEYVEETSHTNAAAATLEATSGSTGALPESAIAFVVRSVIVQNIGHYIPATSRALADAGQLEGLLRNFLISGVYEELEDEIVGGSGSTPHLQGIYTAVTASQAIGGDTSSDALLKAQTAVRVSASINDRYEPDTILAHPNDMMNFRLAKDDNGNYIYGGPTAPRGFSIWGMRPVESLAATSGIPVVGDFTFAQLWVREGVSVTMSDSNSDWFIRNILTLKGQMRAAFKVTRPAAFSEVAL